MIYCKRYYKKREGCLALKNTQFAICLWRRIDAFRHMMAHLALLLSMVFVLLIATTCGAPPQIPDASLPLAVPVQARIGESILVLVGPVRGDDGLPVRLMVVGRHGPTVYNTTFEDGFAQFNITPEHTHAGGYLALIVIAGDARGEASVLLSTRRNTAM